MQTFHRDRLPNGFVRCAWQPSCPPVPGVVPKRVATVAQWLLKKISYHYLAGASSAPAQQKLAEYLWRPPSVRVLAPEWRPVRAETRGRLATCRCRRMERTSSSADAGRVARPGR